MLLGLGLGLVVAGGIYWSDLRAPEISTSAAAPRPSERPAAGASTAAERSTPRAANTAPRENEAAAEDGRFEFYELLPQSEVIVPEVETQALAPGATRRVEEPGRYVLQAGSFRTHADADRRRAELSLLGVESRIQRVVIDDAEFHRVRIGPITDLSELERMRRRLREAAIESMVMKATD